MMKSKNIWQCQELTKTYGTKKALHLLDLTIQDREFLTITGPSGSGKTTLLRIIAGLLEPSSGTIDVSPQIKPILVFQDFQLFPGMTVEGNITFGLKTQKIPKALRQKNLEQLLIDFDLFNQRTQYPSQLSAGQQQRTALARALAVNPQVLLLDEPFAHLDKGLKHSTALYLRELHDRLNITTVMVTHDQEEAMAISTRIVHLSQGQMLQSGSPQELLYSPQCYETARFFGELNKLPKNQTGIENYARPQDLSLISKVDLESLSTVKESSRQLIGRITKKILQPQGYQYHIDCQGTTLILVSSKPEAQIEEFWTFQVDRIILLHSGESESEQLKPIANPSLLKDKTQ